MSQVKSRVVFALETYQVCGWAHYYVVTKVKKKKSPKNSKDEWYPSDSIYQTVVEATKNRVGLEYGTVVSQEREQNIAKKKKRKKSYITECM